jgi:hypothetical protein
MRMTFRLAKDADASFAEEAFALMSALSLS